MKMLLLLLFPFVLFAQTYGLRTLIREAEKENPMIRSKMMDVNAKAEEINAAKSDFWPTVDISAGSVKSNPVTLVDPGVTTSASALIGVDLYDGGRRKAVLDAKRFEHTASLFEKRAFEKSVALNIINSYYAVKKYKATLFALQKRSHELQTQIDRIRRFIVAGLSTEEELDRLSAAYDNNAYSIENTKLAIVEAEERLSLQSGLRVRGLKENHIREPRHVRYEAYEKSKILHAHAQAMKENAKAAGSGYLPQVSLSDSFTASHYTNTEEVPGLTGLLQQQQNYLILKVNMRLFDKGKIKNEQEALKYRKLSLESQKIYADQEQKMHFRVAAKRLKTLRAKLKSTKSGLKASRSTYRAIRKKYEAGMVDNVTYLDALTQVTLSMARYKETLYDYEVAKSIYYYYAGKSPREYIQ